MYQAVISSNSSHERAYEVSSRSAIKAAMDLGRCEGGEVVRIYNKAGRLLSEARWTPEDGGKYYLCAV